MSDQRLRDLERAVRETPASEELRVALDAERRRRGMGSLWAYAPRVCHVPGAVGEGDRGLHVLHVPGAWPGSTCPLCAVAQAEAKAHVGRFDAAFSNEKGWRPHARAEVALVLRVASGLSSREIRRMLREVSGLSGWRLTSHGRKVWGSEVGRAFPALSRKPKPGPVDAPLFDREVPHGA